MYWEETPEERAKSRTTHAARRTPRGVASRERQEYRLVVYRRAQARFREIIADSTSTRTTATWRALQDVCRTCDLDAAEWGLLIRCLMTTAA